MAALEDASTWGTASRIMARFTGVIEIHADWRIVVHPAQPQMQSHTATQTDRQEEQLKVLHTKDQTPFRRRTQQLLH